MDFFMDRISGRIRGTERISALLFAVDDVLLASLSQDLQCVLGGGVHSQV